LGQRSNHVKQLIHRLTGAAASAEYGAGKAFFSPKRSRLRERFQSSGSPTAPVSSGEDGELPPANTVRGSSHDPNPVMVDLFLPADSFLNSPPSPRSPERGDWSSLPFG